MLMLGLTCFGHHHTHHQEHLIQTTNTKTYTNATSYIFTEPDSLSGKQRHRHELLMMGIMVPETC